MKNDSNLENDQPKKAGEVNHELLPKITNDEIDLEAAPPVLLNSPTQDVLGYLANFVPNSDFVLYRRWNDFFDEIYVTSPDSKNFRNDDQLTEFPGSENMDEEAYDFEG